MIIKASWVLSLTLMLASCGDGSLSSLQNISGNISGAVKKQAIEQRQNGSEIELVLSPISVWDDSNTAEESVEVLIDKRPVKIRMRKKDFIEQPYVRIGLLWNSRLDKIYVPVVFFGDGLTDIRRMEIYTDKGFSVLGKADKDVKFNYKNSSLSGGKVFTKVFEMKPHILNSMMDSNTVKIVIKTSRGNLNLGLDIVTDASPQTVEQNARYLFTTFANRMASIKG